MMYQMISDVKELEWFFKHAIFEPLPYESYSLVFVSRHKKLTKEKQETIGLTRKESEFLAVQSIRAPKISSNTANKKEFSFDRFLRSVRKFNVDKYAYTTSLGEPLPQSTLVVLIYINPADDIKVADKVIETINNNKTAIVKAAKGDKKYWSDVLPIYQNFSNLDNNIKHFKAQCKGSVYWLDYDIDVPQWFKDDTTVQEQFRKVFLDKFGRGNFIIVDTAGGYHVLVRTFKIKFNPNIINKEVEQIYKIAVKDQGFAEYEKFECIVNDSQIPGLPLPGTFQYGRPVTVLNKEDFE